MNKRQRCEQVRKQKLKLGIALGIAVSITVATTTVVCGIHKETFDTYEEVEIVEPEMRIRLNLPDETAYAKTNVWSDIMNDELWNIVKDYRNQGISIHDEEVELVCKACFIKMNKNGIQNQDAYLPLLFEDELKNHLIRRAVNARTMLCSLGREAALHV